MDPKRKTGLKRLAPAAAVLLLAASVLFCLSGCSTETGSRQEARLWLDGQPVPAGYAPGGADGDLRVIVTLDGRTLAELPFSEPHTLRIGLPDGGSNTVSLTGDAVFMQEADCEGQDCVQMGQVTRDNLEVRVMGGFIICLPHRISVEVRE